MVEATEESGRGGGGVSYEDEEVSAGVIRDRLIDDGTRLYKSGVNDRTGVENSSLAGG
jgi:hypothetical protein